MNYNAGLNTRKGIISSVIASCLFGLFPIYVMMMPEQANSGHWLAAQRIIWSSLIVTCGLAYFGQLRDLIQLLTNWRHYPVFIPASLIVGCQFWLFVWAPTAGETLSVALGYFSLPLVLVLVGKFVYQEKLRKLQWIAVAIASIGVAYAYLIAQGLSWIVLMVAIGYPIYFMLRKKQPLPSHLAFALDNFLLLPIAFVVVYLLYDQIQVFTPHISMVYYIGMGVLGSASMLLFLLASRSLSLTVFGLMGYLEPVLVFSVGWLLGERIDAQQWPVYLFIILALMVLAIDGLIHVLRTRA